MPYTPNPIKGFEAYHFHLQKRQSLLRQRVCRLILKTYNVYVDFLKFTPYNTQKTWQYWRFLKTSVKLQQKYFLWLNFAQHLSLFHVS